MVKYAIFLHKFPYRKNALQFLTSAISLMGIFQFTVDDTGDAYNYNDDDTVIITITIMMTMIIIIISNF